MKIKLTEYFGDNIVITNMDRKVDVVTFTSIASNILNCFYEVAADLVKYDKKYKHTSKDIYIQGHSLKKHSTFVLKTLHLLLIPTKTRTEDCISRRDHCSSCQPQSHEGAIHDCPSH